MTQSLKELEKFCRDKNIRLALENLPEKGSYQQMLIPTIQAFSPEFLGFCCDIGHNAITKDSDDQQVKNACRNQLAYRLIAVHIHDNDSSDDKHWLPFTGAVDWQDVARFLRLADYRKPLNLEVSFPGSGIASEELFVQQAHVAVSRLQQLIAELKE